LSKSSKIEGYNKQVAERHNIIEVNGKRYDARTGKLLSGHPAAKVVATPKPGQALDGFTKKPRTASNTSHSVHTKTIKSKTLMRTAVKKPLTPKAVKRTAVALDSIQKPKRHITTPKLAEVVDPHRIARAEQVGRSSMISKFGFGTLRVHAQPSYLPVKDAPNEPPAITTPLQHAPINPFQSALDKATGHTHPKLAKQKRHHKMARKLRMSNKSFAASSAAVALFIVGGFFAYQKMPNVAVRVASAKAGVRGSVPSYHPAGFGVSGPIKFAPGEITLKYQSTTDQRNFEVKQRATEWNNEALLKNFVTVNNRPYQTLQKDDKTIFIYDDNNATWLERGVWYQVEGNSSLSSDQLIRIADSIK
jgi:hypothetical protein